MTRWFPLPLFLLALLIVGCGSDRDKGVNRNSDRPRTVEKEKTEKKADKESGKPNK